MCELTLHVISKIVTFFFFFFCSVHVYVCVFAWVCVGVVCMHTRTCAFVWVQEEKCITIIIKVYDHSWGEGVGGIYFL